MIGRSSQWPPVVYVPLSQELMESDHWELHFLGALCLENEMTSSD